MKKIILALVAVMIAVVLWRTIRPMDISETASEETQIKESQIEEETKIIQQEISVSEIETQRISDTQIRITWAAPENADVIRQYILKRCLRKMGEDNGEWETAATVMPEEAVGGTFTVTDTLADNAPQQFSYRVELLLSDNDNYCAGEGRAAIASNVMICIDPGHYAGGTTITGEDSYDYTEGVFTLEIAKELKSILKDEYGIDSYMTRDSGVIELSGYTDEALDRGHISLRGEYALEKESTLFISLHTNANLDNANGYPTCGQPENITKSLVFINRVGIGTQVALDCANAIGTALSKTNADLGLATIDTFSTVVAEDIREWTDAYNDSLDTAGTVCKRMKDGEDYYGVLRGASEVGVPGLIVEHGFHTVAKMRRLAAEGSLAREWAWADAYGIAEGFDFIE